MLAMKDVKIVIKISIFFFVLLPAVSSEQKLYKDSSGKRYIIETEPKYNWFEAFRECKDPNYQFLIIDSEEKNKGIVDLLRKDIKNVANLWLGGHDDFGRNSNDNGPFIWSGTGEKFQFNYWSDNAPDVKENESHCVHISNSTPEYRWNKANCETKMGFICAVTTDKLIF